MKRFGIYMGLLALVSGGYSGYAMDQTVVLEDNFDTAEPNPSKWDVVITNSVSCSVDIDSNQLRASVYGDNVSTHVAYLASKSIPLPNDWTAVIVTGKWKVTAADTGEFNLRFFEAGDESKYVLAAYGTWTTYPWNHFRRIDSNGTADYIARAIPSSYKTFELRVTPTGWSFTEDGQTLADITTSHMADMSAFQIQFGSADYSGLPAEIVYIDDIQVVLQTPSQPGDTCENPLVVDSLPYTDTQNSGDFHHDMDFLCGQEASVSPDVVYQFTPEADMGINIHLAGAGFDPKVAVYKNGCEESDLIACNLDDQTLMDFTTDAHLYDVPLQGYQTYYIIADGEGGSAGDYQISITQGDLLPGCPAGNSICQLPVSPYGGWSALASDEDLSHTAMENFETDGRYLYQIVFWGITFDEYYFYCQEPEYSWQDYFQVRIYADSGGVPGASIYSDYFPSERIDTGVQYSRYGNLQQFRIALPFLEIPAPTGWISIRGIESYCRFAWMASGEGDGLCYSNSQESFSHDLAVAVFITNTPIIAHPRPTDQERNIIAPIEASWFYNGPTPVTYDVYACWEGEILADFDKVASGLTEPNCQFSSIYGYPLWPETVYKWFVVAHGPDGDLMGPVWSFTTSRSLPGDIDYDQDTDLADLALFAAQWLETGCSTANSFCSEADINGDSFVDLTDYSIFAKHWLGDLTPPPAHNLCENAIPLPLGIIYSGNNTYAEGTDITLCGSHDNLDVWHSFTASQDGEYTFILWNTDFYTATLSLFESCGSSPLQCSTILTLGDFTNQYISYPRLQMPLATGQTVLLRVGADGNSYPPYGSYRIGVWRVGDKAD